MEDGHNVKLPSRWRRLAATAAGVLLVALMPFVLPALDPARDLSAPAEGRVTAVFGADCETMVIREIDRAEREIVLAIYSFTRRNISRALARAAKRGVSVRVKFDRRQSEWRGMKQAVGYLRNRGIPCEAIALPGDYASMHHKFMVIDNARVLTGSYNYTTTATTRNCENLVLVESERIAAIYRGEFERVRSRRDASDPENKPD